MKKVCSVLLSFSLFFSLVTSCLAASQDTIIGNWQGDADLLMAQPDIQVQFEGESTEVQEAMLAYLEALNEMLKVEIAEDTLALIVDIESQEKDIANYIVTDAVDNKVYITIIDEVNADIVIEIVDEDHIIMYEVAEGGLETGFCLKRVK